MVGKAEIIVAVTFTRVNSSKALMKRFNEPYSNEELIFKPFQHILFRDYISQSYRMLARKIVKGIC